MRTLFFARAAALAALVSLSVPQAWADDFSWRTQTLLDQAVARHAGDADALARDLRLVSSQARQALATQAFPQDRRGQLEFVAATFADEADRAVREKAQSATVLGALFGSADKVDGACGWAAGSAAAQSPSQGLCAQGDPSGTFGFGPWYWDCAGRAGGRSALCSSGPATSGYPVQNPAPWAGRVDGACGALHANTDAQSLSAGTWGLCAAGQVGGFTSVARGNGATSWSWKCAGSNGGLEASCWANGRSRQADAACGSAAGKAFPTAPTYNLCASGTPSWVSGGGPWSWTCYGGAGGASVACQSPVSGTLSCPASYLTVDGVTYPLPATPDGGRAVVAAPTYEKIDGGTRWPRRQFQCAGGIWSAQGFASWSVSCDAGWSARDSQCSRDAVTAACGWANGQSFSSAPSSGLCNAGLPGSVTAAGTSWSWTCWGTNATAPVSCWANRNVPATDGACGSAQGGTYQSVPTWGLCSVGAASSVWQANGSWRWNCAGWDGGSTAACWARSTESWGYAACGSAQGGTYSSQPTWGLCDAGTASWVQASGNQWSWTCSPNDGGSARACWAYRSDNGYGQYNSYQNGSCGSADGGTFSSRPTWGLCSSGYATNVSGWGPWYWTCTGNGYGSSESCSAYRDGNRYHDGDRRDGWHDGRRDGDRDSSAGRQDGSCGSAQGGSYSSAPSDGLCDVGTASWVAGAGPWTWTCYGVGGGTSASCRASR